MSNSAVFEGVGYFAEKRWLNVTFPIKISAALYSPKSFYNTTAESFNIKKLCSRLLSMKKSVL